MCKPKKRIIASHIKIKTKMKVKNLLLAGLAVAAMTACSNDIDEIVDNGNQTPTEEASMKLYFNFANQTRATGDNSGDKVNGEEVEWNVNQSSITVVLQYANGGKKLVYDKLTPITEAANGAKKYTTTEFTVDAGNDVTVYAFINPNNLNIDENVNPATLALTETLILPETGLGYLAAGIAAPNKFMMSGKTAKSINIVAGRTDNKAEINVDRVAAKLDEKTQKTPFTIDAQGVKYTDKDDKTAAVKIQLLSHSYSNLSNNTFALNETRDKSYFNSTIGAINYLQAYSAQGSYPLDTYYKWLTKKEDADNEITYCLENYGNSNPTKVHYKGQVYIGETAIKSDFYIRAVQNPEAYYIFKDLAEMKAYYNDAAINAITAETSREDLANLGIKKYDGGICYYEATINTIVPDKAASILRNNWYKLNVSKIKEIGTPTPALDPEDKTTKLVVETTINPWTIQVNDFEL